MATGLRHQIVTAGDMSGTVTSETFDATEAENIFVHAVWTGTPTGTLAIQYSNDDTNWVTVDSIATGGAAGQHSWNHTTGTASVRVVFTFTSGTGTLNVHVTGKGW